jgi:hypothetical protein
MDEDFMGWGGEDVEFWGRVCTRRVWNYGFLPILHLWHAPQPGKLPAKKTLGMARLAQVEAISPAERISYLRSAREAASMNGGAS